MSEHTKGRLNVDGALLRAENNNVVVNASSRPRLWEGDLRRLAACWNAFEFLSTEQIEATTASRDHELNAARALLREVLDQHAAVNSILKNGSLYKLPVLDRVQDYLDACDTLGDGNG